MDRGDSMGQSMGGGQSSNPMVCKLTGERLDGGTHQLLMA